MSESGAEILLFPVNEHSKSFGQGPSGCPGFEVASLSSSLTMKGSLSEKGSRNYESYFRGRTNSCRFSNIRVSHGL